MLGAIAMPVAGVVTGVGEMVGGIANTPGAVSARLEVGVCYVKRARLSIETTTPLTPLLATNQINQNTHRAAPGTRFSGNG